MSEYIIVTDKPTIDKLMLTYFSVVSDKQFKKALRCFSQKRGYGEEFVAVLFKYDFDDFDLAQLSKPIDDSRVILEMDYPAADKDTQVYLTFNEFYDYLINRVSAIIEDNPEEKSELNKLLLEVKIGFNL
ncbi:hypothetical protein [Bacillus nitratireducens]|uniref:CDI immunity protein domain-containing protein n=1 Tax=Bacillus nitratireducens TaxID=2026193 RepID=A0ABU6PMH4_9BACI|nr:hypothetical protein [Bacillus nitratireducens]OSX89310.1 hypothetical protein BTJ45_04953 [Bacillus mycoides]PDY25834.1 hypothetical protein COM83_02720 [Bacillus cereus]MDR4171231.1 hypothetical protein [Bacillus nitratireducens]MED4681815.1 hypothetical protein [Bacillus nitratireducens]PEA28859.1 hypothetical protein CON44_02305 [Bacillus cereus]